MAAKGGPDLDCGDRGWGDIEAGTTLNVTQPTSSVPDYCQRDDAASYEVAPLQCSRSFRNGSMLLKKSLSTADQNFSRPLMRFSDKNVRDLVF